MPLTNKIVYKLFLFCFINCLFLFNSVWAQNASYLDSISNNLNQLSNRDKINVIMAIPYDKAVGDIKTYESLSDKAIQMAKEINDSLLLANSYEKKVLALHFSSKTEQAITLSLVIAKIYEGLDMQAKVGETYCNIGWKLKYLDLNKSFEYTKQGIRILEQYYDSKIINPAYDNFGALYVIRKQWDSAIYYHKKSLKIKKQLNDSVGIPFGFSHLANVYLKTKKFDLAEKYLDSSLSIRKKRNDIYGISDSYLYYGDLYFVKKDYNKAIESFKKGFEYSNKNNYYPLKKYASEYLYKSYDSIKNYREALKYNLLFNKLKDSVLNVETNTRINQLEIEYQTEKKEKEIISQSAAIAKQNESLNKKNTQLYGLGILAILLTLLGYLFFNQQKLKNHQLHKENELKDALLKIENQNRLQEQRLRISRDLHDNIGAQLTFIISSLDNLKYGFKLPQDLGNKLTGLSAFTSTTIYELRDTIWAMNKSEINFEDLQTRISNFIEKANSVSEITKFNFTVDKEISTNYFFSSVEGMNIYRIIQESVNNAIKYAEASAIDVNFKKQKAYIKLVIKDNGKGFDISQVEMGNGLNNIKKRAKELNAEIEIESVVGIGTTVKMLRSINT